MTVVAVKKKEDEMVELHPFQQQAFPGLKTVYMRTMGKLRTAMLLDHSDTVPPYRKNKRADELRCMVESAFTKRSLCMLSVAAVSVDVFLATGL